MKKIAIVSAMMFVFTVFASTALANSGSSGLYIIDKIQQDSQKRIEAKQQEQAKSKKEEKNCVAPQTDSQQKSEYCKS